MRLHLVQPADLEGLLAAASLGDDRAGRVLGATKQALSHIEQAPQEKPALCACCPRALLRGGEFSIAVAAAEREDDSRFLVIAVCATCAREREDARRMAVSAVRRLWPAAREIMLHTDAGHA